MIAWDEEKYGARDQYELTDNTKIDGVSVCDYVTMAVDNAEDGYFEGDEGVVIGIGHQQGGLFTPEPYDYLLVYFHGMDPVRVRPEHLEGY